MREHRLKRALSTAMIVAGCLFFTLSIFAIWLDRVITDTDTYVSTVAPLASDPTIQSAVTDRISSELFSRADVEQLAREALPSRAEFLAPALAEGMKNAIDRQIKAVVASDRFQHLWENANRASHNLVLGILLGKGGAISADQGRISVDLGAALGEVSQRLDQAGINFLNRPLSQQTGVELTLFQSDKIASIQRGLDLLDRLAWLLPIVTIVFLSAAVWLMPRRLSALLWTGMGIAAATALTLVALAAVRGYYLDSLSGSDVSPDDAMAVVDIFIRSLKTVLKGAFVFGFLVAGGAFIAGPSDLAVRLRKMTVDVWREAGSRAGAPGPLAGWIDAHRTGLRIGGFVAGLLFLILLDQPTLPYLLLTVMALFIYLGAIELFGGGIRLRQK